jgi:3-oxoacyl-[acyl-carrier-protein] synthase I
MAVVAAGAVTALGTSAQSTCAAIRSGLNDFQETDFVDNTNEQVLGASVPPELLEMTTEADGSTTGGLSKLAAMFVTAAHECARNAGGIDPTKTALLLVGPESTRPGISAEHLSVCFDATVAALGKTFHPASRITQVGSPGLAATLQYGQSLLTDPQSSGVSTLLVAGLDSFLNAEDINYALRSGRLLTAENSDGFIPGEACVCLLVTRLDAIAASNMDEHGKSVARQSVLAISGLGFAAEEQTLNDDHPARGRGLARAISHAIKHANVKPEDIHQRVSDASAESYFFEEASYAWSRILRTRSASGHTFMTPMNRVGHIGAAMGPLAVALALDMARNGWGAGSLSLIQLSSSDKARGALVLEAC